MTLIDLYNKSIFKNLDKNYESQYSWTIENANKIVNTHYNNKDIQYNSGGYEYLSIKPNESNNKYNNEVNYRATRTRFLYDTVLKNTGNFFDLSKFQFGPIYNQLFLQSLNPTKETRIWNPASLASSLIPAVHFERHLSLFGPKNYEAALSTDLTYKSRIIHQVKENEKDDRIKKSDPNRFSNPTKNIISTLTSVFNGNPGPDGKYLQDKQIKFDTPTNTSYFGTLWKELTLTNKYLYLETKKYKTREDEESYYRGQILKIEEIRRTDKSVRDENFSKEVSYAKTFGEKVKISDTDEKNKYSSNFTGNKSIILTSFPHYDSKDGENRKDKINKLSVIQNRDYKNDDLIPFKFVDVRNGQTLIFRATLANLNESITPNWNSIKYVGRADPLFVYSNTDRNINFDFKIILNSEDELLSSYQKLNYLVGLSYPIYQDLPGIGKYMTAPFVKLTIGDLFKDVYGIIDGSTTITFSDEIGWDTGKIKVPKFIEVNISSFTPFSLTNKPMETGRRFYSIGGVEQYKAIKQQSTAGETAGETAEDYDAVDAAFFDGGFPVGGNFKRTHDIYPSNSFFEGE